MTTCLKWLSTDNKEDSGGALRNITQNSSLHSVPPPVSKCHAVDSTRQNAIPLTPLPAPILTQLNILNRLWQHIFTLNYAQIGQ